MLVHEIKDHGKFVRYLELLNLDIGRLNLFVIVEISMEGVRCEFILSTESFEPNFSYKWLI